MRVRSWKKFAVYVLINQILIMGIMVGMYFNFLAVSSNGGKMPVYYYDVANPETHFTYYYPSEVNHPLLTDIIAIPKIGQLSIGDVVMFTSVGVYAVGVVLVFFLRKWEIIT